MYTRETCEWADWGIWKCLSVGVACKEIDPDYGAAVTGAKAEKYMEKEWLENGRKSWKAWLENGQKSWKAWTRNKLCTNEMSGSAPWIAMRAYSKIQTWKFSKLGKRRMLNNK
jgi:hypothetical protein